MPASVSPTETPGFPPSPNSATGLEDTYHLAGVKVCEVLPLSPFGLKEVITNNRPLMEPCPLHPPEIDPIDSHLLKLMKTYIPLVI